MVIIFDEEPWLLHERLLREKADYDEGFATGPAGKECDDTKSRAWQRGWAGAQE
jgi:hypothetical protein